MNDTYASSSMTNSCDILNQGYEPELPGVCSTKGKKRKFSLKVPPRDPKTNNEISVREESALDDGNDDDTHNNSLNSFSVLTCRVSFDTTTL